MTNVNYKGFFILVTALYSSCGQSSKEMETQFNLSNFGGSSPTLIADNQPGANDILIDEQNVYWTNFSESGSVMKWSRQGGNVVTIAEKTKYARTTLL